MLSPASAGFPTGLLCSCGKDDISLGAGKPSEICICLTPANKFLLSVLIVFGMQGKWKSSIIGIPILGKVTELSRLCIVLLLTGRFCGWMQLDLFQKCSELLNPAG